MTDRLTVFAVGAHPDDIEFLMSGTLLLLKQAGADTHYMNIANGCYGSAVHPKEEAARIRTGEAQAAARLAGATYHHPVADDLGVLYTPGLLAAVSARVREIQPDIVLTLSRYDYMEDHEYASRLASSAAFNRCLGFYVTDPPRPPTNKPVAVYHCLPHTLMDMQRTPVAPEFVVDVASVMDTRRAMLACHASQKDWLDATQGMDSYVETMVGCAREVARRWGPFEYAEGWRRHNHMGYCAEGFAPLQEALKPFIADAGS
ncbi:MAG: PIG-L family deacetylase [Kiritimatiellaeota bacterium]|nr:PIG-L family deacetylase [Kiritimatiellota bacterium]